MDELQLLRRLHELEHGEDRREALYMQFHDIRDHTANEQIKAMVQASRDFFKERNKSLGMKKQKENRGGSNSGGGDRRPPGSSGRSHAKTR